MIDVAWDPLTTHRQLSRLTVDRSRFRLRRTIRRIRSSRRLVASALATALFIGYVLSGIYILSARAAADPNQLRLWFSGGMAIYLIYHIVRCFWSKQVSDLELTDAESLWLGGAPLRRSSLAIYHVNTVVLESFLKTLLLVVILARDVQHVELLLVGVFTSLLLLQVIRLIAKRWIGGLDPASFRFARILATVVGLAVLAQVIARLFASVPFGSPTHRYVAGIFSQLGATAACDMIHWLSICWWPASRLIVAQQYDAMTWLSLVLSIAVIRLAIISLVKVDAWVANARFRRDRQRLDQGEYETHATSQTAARTLASRRQSAREIAGQSLPSWSQDALALMGRQAVTIRRYRATILFSFVIPTLLCLSPLATGQVVQQWLFVVGGIALCTMLLAPSALRIDFRRDLRRMMLLRSLPVKPLSMVLGQIAYPIAITLAFQWLTLIIAAAITQPSWSQIVLWTGMLGALALFTFSCENALFLAYPHHEHSQGIAMIVRAKLTFLGKFAVILTAITALVIWASVCSRWLPESAAGPAMVCGSIMGTWLIALASLTIAVWCWRRFDLAHDVPPQ